MWLEKRGNKYSIVWREGERVRRKTAYTDKLASNLLLAKMQKAQERGEMDAVDKFEPHKRRPIADLIVEYTADMTANGRDEKYIYITDRRLTKLAEFVGWKILGDINADGLRRYRVAHAAKKSGKTLNQFATTLNTFCEWCVVNGRLAANPVGKLKPASEDAKRRRRALTQDELHKLLTAAAPARRIVYLTAVGTGLRRGELGDLQWQDLRLDSPTPHIKLRASATKARRADTIAIKAEVAAELRKIRPEDAEPTDAVFSSVPSLARFIRDLDTAGVDHGFTWIVESGAWKRDDDRTQVDFHSLRKTLNTMLLMADVNVATGMKQMRLTDRKLYDHTYADKAVFDTAAALAKLPDFQPAEVIVDAVAATGTTGEGSGEKSRVANRVATATLTGPFASTCNPMSLNPTNAQSDDSLRKTNKKRLPEFGKRDSGKAPGMKQKPNFGVSRAANDCKTRYFQVNETNATSWNRDG